MNLYKKCGNIKINGVNKVLYSKAGTQKKYVIYKNRYISLNEYKKKGGTIPILVNPFIPGKVAKPMRERLNNSESQFVHVPRNTKIPVVLDIFKTLDLPTGKIKYQAIRPDSIIKKFA